MPKTIALPELFQERVPSSVRCFSTLVLMLANISRRASLPSRAPDHIARPFRVGRAPIADAQVSARIPPEVAILAVWASYIMLLHSKVAQLRAQGRLHRVDGRVVTDDRAADQLELHGVAVQRI